MHSLRYQRVIWHHEFDDEPVVLWSEVGDDGYERRKVDEYRNGRLQYATENTSTGTTRLSDEAMPGIAEIGEQREFTASAVTADEFESTWRRATWVERFNAWVWKPPYWSLRVRGMANATLEVSAGGFSVQARPLEQRIGRWSEVDYRWPAVVVQTLRPFGSPLLLFEMSGRLASCAVMCDRRRLREALRRSGVAIVDVERWGWEAPKPVCAVELGAHVDDVPAAIVKR